MKYDLMEGSPEIGGYVIDGDLVRLNIPERTIDIPLAHCIFREGKLFAVKPVVMLERGEAVPINRYKLWME